MLILILINVQYLKNFVFSIEEGSNGQNHSLSDFHHLLKHFSLQNSPLILNVISKTLGSCVQTHWVARLSLSSFQGQSNDYQELLGTFSP